MTQMNGLERKRIAFFGGGVSTIPSYRALLNSLCRYYSVTVYFEFYHEIKYPIKFSVKVIPKVLAKFRRAKYVYFAFMIFKDMILGKIDLIHAHSTYPSGICAIFFGKIFRIPVVVSLDAAEASGLPGIEFGDLLSRKRTLINKLVIGQADEVISLTNFQLGEVRNNLSVVRNINVIPRGVDSSKFSYREKSLVRPVNILNVAYLHPVKDQIMLLNAYSLILDKIQCNLIHIGEDFQNGEIQRLANKMGIANKIKFIGLVPNDELPHYYSDAYILLHTSLYESQAVVVNEAMASGVLVCGSHVGLLADLADDCCITVPPGEPDQLAKAVLELLADSDRMHRLRVNAYEWSQRHDLEWTSNQHKAIYERLLSTTLSDTP